MSIERSAIVCGALATGAAVFAGYLLVKQHPLQPDEIFSLSSPTGQTFPVNVKLLDGSVVPVPGCFSEMSVAELRMRVAVALQTPPGRVCLQLDGLPIDRDLTLAGAGISGESVVDFRTSLLGGIRPAEAALLRTYTQLLCEGQPVALSRVEVFSWYTSLNWGEPLGVVNDYAQQITDLDFFLPLI